MAMPQAPKLESLDDFIEWENAQSDRHEFIGSAIREKPGSTDAHNTIAGKLAVALRTALRGSPCRAFIADMKLRVDVADAIFYPDLMVTCDPHDPRDSAPDADVAKRHPRLLTEVLSESTAA